MSGTMHSQFQACLARDHWVVLDTETTGLGPDDQVVQLAVVDGRGRVLINTLLRPTKKIPWFVTQIHGITNEQVADAPSLADPNVLAEIIRVLQGRDIIAYNADFDLRMLKQSSLAYGLGIDWRRIAHHWLCAMRAYEERFGRAKLSVACAKQGIPVRDAHSAVGDCQMTRALVHCLAQTD